MIATLVLASGLIVGDPTTISTQLSYSTAPTAVTANATISHGAIESSSSDRHCSTNHITRRGLQAHRYKYGLKLKDSC